MNTRTSIRLAQNTLFKLSKKNLNKSFRPTMYNLRLYYSNLNRNSQSFGKWETIYGPEGFEKTKTDRNPENFKYKTNLWNHTVYELRHIYGDVLYQIFRRRHRLADPFMKFVYPSAVAALYVLSGQHLCFMVGLYIISLDWISVIILCWFWKSFLKNRRAKA